MINWIIEEINKIEHKKVKFYYLYKLDFNEVERLNDTVFNIEYNLYDIYHSYKNDSIMGVKISKSRFTKDSEDGYLYEIRNIITNKRYIGRSINPSSRIIDHIKSTSSKKLKEDFIKYGLINFTFKCWLCKNYKEEERKLISEIGLENLYNSKI